MCRVQRLMYGPRYPSKIELMWTIKRERKMEREIEWKLGRIGGFTFYVNNSAWLYCSLLEYHTPGGMYEAYRIT